jgi:hypothetical protein
MLDTRLESVGAEFLVLGHLLVEGISAHKEYVNRPGRDLIAENAKKKRLARIQVKSRFASDANGFPISNFDCEFVVYAKLNRGFLYSRGNPNADKTPVFYVLPIAKVKKALKGSSRWGKQYRVYVRDFQPIDRYVNAWDLIRKYLRIRPRRMRKR